MTFGTKVKIALRRVARGDFQLERATDHERAELAAARPPVVSPVAQDYAAWRGSILWAATVAAGANALFEFLGFHPLAEQLPPQALAALGPGNVALVDWAGRSGIIALLVGSGLVLLAALSWRAVRASILLARTGWLVMFLTPFVLAALPYTRMMDLGHLAAPVRERLTTALGTAFALSIFFSVGPRAVALFPGIIRSSLAVKTLLPESPSPGWVVTIVGPLYSVFLLVLVAGVIQTQASFFLLGGVVCMMLSPAVYVVRRKALIRPQTPAEAARVVSTTKRAAGIFSLAGVVLLTIFVVRRPQLEVWNLLGFLMGVVGNVLVLTVVGADLVLGMLRAAHEQQRSFHESELARSLDEKLRALAEPGIAGAPTRAGGPPPT
jgi:hypothetical protein